MFCPKCGKELLQAARFCDACGTPADLSQTPPAGTTPNEPVEEKATDIYADYPQTAPAAPASEPEKPRKKRLALKIIALFLVAVFLISGVAVLGYHTFLPAKMTLKAAQYFTLQKSWQQLDQALTRTQQKVDALYDTSIKTDTKINLLMDSDFLSAFGLDKQTAELLVGFINDFTFQAVTEMDMPNKRENINISLNYLNNPMLSLNGFIDNDRIGLSLPELSKKGVAGRLKDLPRLVELYPEDLRYSGLDSLSGFDPWLSSSMAKEFTIDRKDLKKLMETYGMLFVNSIDSSDMSIKRGRTTQLFGEKISCQEVTITLDQRAQMDLIGSLLDTMKDDDVLYDAVFSKGAKILEMMASSNPLLAQGMRSADMQSLFSKSQIRMLLSSLKRSLSKDMFPKYMEIKVYIKGYDVVKYELELPLTTPGEKLIFSYENLIDGNESKKGFSIDVNSGGDHIAAYLNIDKQYDEKSDTEDLLVEFNADLAGSVPGNIHLTFNSDQDPNGAKEVKGKVNLALDFLINDQSGSFSIEADTRQVRNKNGLPENIEVIADISLDIPSALPQPVGLTTVFESDIQYDVTVTPPDWSESAIDLATASREELDAFIMEIMETIDSIMELARYMY